MSIDAIPSAGVNTEASEWYSSPERIEAFIQQQPETRGAYQGSLAEAEDGVYISPVVLTPELQERGIEFVEVELLPGAQLGAGDSHHEVTFGRVSVRIGDEAQQVDVAIKPFTADSEKAGHEHDSLLAAKQRGLDTFEPLALARDGDVVYLITKKRSDIETRDNADWTISPSDEERFDAHVRPELAAIAETMAEMHAAGVFHGDAQPKNFARTDTGSTIPIDLEDAVFVDSDAVAEAINGVYGSPTSQALQDVEHCWYIMLHPTSTASTNLLLEGENHETCMQVFEQDFLDVYLRALGKMTSSEVAIQLQWEELKQTIVEKVARTT